MVRKIRKYGNKRCVVRLIYVHSFIGPEISSLHEEPHLALAHLINTPFYLLIYKLSLAAIFSINTLNPKT
ncbi:hypothetical protein H5410_055424 [Solanum commersonii]|uniref:Uncharacterized protein n=1 Tax=Solanum commersonii TaxID=4109 RepID=A0A9J5WI85_SOLCO|nr:hypothetical protein H5410_055424 [Solanum commersonii]